MRPEAGLPNPTALALAACLAWGLSAPAEAQSPPASVPPVSGGSGRALAIEASISAQLQWMDNLTLATSAARESGWMLQLTPGVRAQLRSAHWRGHLHYAPMLMAQSAGPERSRVAHHLTTQALGQWFEDRLTLEAQATLRDQSRSSFGVQAAVPTIDHANQAQTATLSLMPRWHSLLGPWAEIDASWRHTEQRVRDTANGDMHTDHARIGLTGRRQGALNWQASLSEERMVPALGAVATRQMGVASLIGQFDADWQAVLRAGRERTQWEGGSGLASTTYGAQLTWQPSRRTLVQAGWDHHRYGNAHQLVAQYRTPRSVWRVSDVRSVQFGGLTGGAQTLPTWQALLDSLYSSREPDPVRRAQWVAAQLQQAGLSPTALADAAVLSSRATLQRRQELAWSLEGVRTRLHAQLYRLRSQRLGQAGVLADDFSLTEAVRQKGAAVSLLHRFSPSWSASLMLSAQRSEATTGPALYSGTDSALLAVTHRLGPRTDAGWGLRHSRMRSSTHPTQQNAINATLVHRF